MVASVDTSEIQALYFAQGAELKKSVYTDDNLTQNLEGEIANISLNLAISDDLEEIEETDVYALKAYATEDLSDEGFEVRDEDGLRLVVGYTSGSAAKLYAVANGTLIDKEINLTGEEVGTFSVTVDQTGATVVINGEVRSSISAVVGTAINWEVSKEGYLTQSGSTSITSGGSTQAVTLEEVPTGGGGVALSIVANPSDATITMNSESQSTVIGDVGDTVTYSVAKTGYTTVSGTETLSTSKVLNVTLYKTEQYTTYSITSSECQFLTTMYQNSQQFAPNSGEEFILDGSISTPATQFDPTQGGSWTLEFNYTEQGESSMYCQITEYNSSRQLQINMPAYITGQDYETHIYEPLDYDLATGYVVEFPTHLLAKFVVGGYDPNSGQMSGHWEFDITITHTQNNTTRHITGTTDNTSIPDFAQGYAYFNCSDSSVTRTATFKYNSSIVSGS